MFGDFYLTFVERQKCYKSDKQRSDKKLGSSRKVIVWRRGGETDGGSQREKSQLEKRWRRKKGRFGGEGFPDEAQLTAQTYSALMTGLTT